MSVQQLEQIRRDYTDKLVLVDPSRPELARFRDVVGRVKTVNMNGRALVEFDEYHSNIGWYDIAPEYLKVVDQPPPKPEKKKAPAKAEAKPAAAKKAGAPASAGAPAGAKLSVAEMLAAARAGGAAGSAPAAPKASAAIPAKEPAAPAPAKKAAPAPVKSSERVDKSKMSIADMVAWCREYDTK